MHTQVGIIGAGPAGLMLGHLLHLRGIDSVILESRTREHVIERVRAGVLEQGTVDLMTEAGVGERLGREGMRHEGIHIAFGGRRHRIDMAGLTGGRAITIYGQHEVVKDLIDARLATGRPLHFEVGDVALLDLTTSTPRIRYVARPPEAPTHLRARPGVRARYGGQASRTPDPPSRAPGSPRALRRASPPSPRPTFARASESARATAGKPPEPPSPRTPDPPNSRIPELNELTCDFVAGCDGFHGICRPSIPSSHLRIYEREYPFGWLGILAKAPPSSDELVYSRHDRGFALFSMRSQSVTRLYLQCAPDEDVERWSDDRIWSELQARLQTDDGWRPTEGKILQKGVTGMRSFVAEPMRYGRLFLAGDSAHIVPPTGAKGLNLAMADVSRLAEAIASFYRSGSEALLDAYSGRGLRRTWRAQRFSWWMTTMLHRSEEENAFDRRRQLAELEYLVGSRSAMTSLAENYVGWPFD